MLETGHAPPQVESRPPPQVESALDADMPLDKRDLLELIGRGAARAILSGRGEFWEAFACLNYDRWGGAGCQEEGPGCRAGGIPGRPRQRASAAVRLRERHVSAQRGARG